MAAGFTVDALLAWKFVSMAAMLVLTVVCSYSPWMIRKRFSASRTLMSFLTCLAGGVVLGALLMHMLPELGHGGCASGTVVHKAIVPMAARMAGPGVVGDGAPGGTDGGDPADGPDNANDGSDGKSKSKKKKRKACTRKGCVRCPPDFNGGFCGVINGSNDAKPVGDEKDSKSGIGGASGNDHVSEDGSNDHKDETGRGDGKKSKKRKHKHRKGRSKKHHDHKDDGHGGCTSCDGSHSHDHSDDHSHDHSDDHSHDHSDDGGDSHDSGDGGGGCGKGGCSHGKHGKKGKHGAHGHGGHSHGFQWGYFMAGISFLVLLAVDRFFMHAHSHDHEHASPQAVARAVEAEGGVVVDEPASGRSMVVVMGRRNSATLDAEKLDACHSSDACCAHEAYRAAPVHEHPCTDSECAVERVLATSPPDDDCASCHSDNVMGGCHMDGLDRHSSRTQALVFVVALSMHSFLEGLGMGTKNTKETLGLYLISLFGHKWLEAFALGVNVMNASFSRTYAAALIFFYSVLTPVGMLIGMAVDHFAAGKSFAGVAVQVLNGLAVGSFLFVSCIEMIPPEFHKRTPHTPAKFAILVTGFLFMAAISLVHYH